LLLTAALGLELTPSGTGSGRACLVDRDGNLLADHSVETQTHRSPSDHRIFEQSTADIWGALAQCSKKVLADSGVDPKQVKGVGFDATCSLAVTDRGGRPVSVSRSQGEAEDDANLGSEGEWNVILWADHRAEEEADAINASGEGVLNFVGGTMSVRTGTSRADTSSRWRRQRPCG
jgi:ribulose kinase